MGSTAAATVADCDPCTLAEENIILSRPLVTLTATEIALAYRAMTGRNVAGIPSFAHSLLSAKQTNNSSSRSIAEAFLNRLERGHTHSLNALTGTASKLDTRGTVAPEWLNCVGSTAAERKGAVTIATLPRCGLCRLVQAHAAPVAVAPSTAASECAPTDCGSNGACGCLEGVAAPAVVVPFLCRACELIVEQLHTRRHGDGGADASLVPDVLAAFAPAKKSIREAQRERIKDCLLSDGEDDD